MPEYIRLARRRTSPLDESWKGAAWLVYVGRDEIKLGLALLSSMYSSSYEVRFTVVAIRDRGVCIRTKHTNRRSSARLEGMSVPGRQKSFPCLDTY